LLTTVMQNDDLGRPPVGSVTVENAGDGCECPEVRPVIDTLTEFTMSPGWSV